ncbi:ead/Ea22-like family protein [Klebsiella pneumoniae]|uniref:ead/Ea22-like family protein n=1 Tax=Klebsiella pneumoniae TaxID=573 RepID=UPI001F46A09C|nr:ead/Ea22-like family protein [Klebsiella pneumoniae]MCF6857024.1 ead/Ea22-like family protein [Klebsiella pneumoniae]MDR4741848.1 ead/Ea22-like family protein [Klebsiella pneumoniae]
MTTDITELSQSLKAAATNVKETAHIARYLKATIARQTFKELMTPENILALVEALEKAQKRIAELENYAEAEAAGADRAAEDSVYWMKRCKELESRTVTFKLPFTPEPSAFAPWVAKAFYQFHKDTVKSCVAVFSDACAAAGIKVEAE